MADLDARLRATCDLLVPDIREGAGFSPPRFHRAMLDLGSPPLGILGAAIDRS